MVHTSPAFTTAESLIGRQYQKVVCGRLWTAVENTSKMALTGQNASPQVSLKKLNPRLVKKFHVALTALKIATACGEPVLSFILAGFTGQDRGLSFEHLIPQERRTTL
jgi:hypothetical protein